MDKKVGKRVAKKAVTKKVPVKRGHVKKFEASVEKQDGKTPSSKVGASKKVLKKASKRGAKQDTLAPQPSFQNGNFDDGPERFAHLVGVMLDEKLSAHEAKIEEIISSLNRQNSFISSLRDEVRPRLANHEKELEEIRADIRDIRFEISNILETINNKQ